MKWPTGQINNPCTTFLSQIQITAALGVQKMFVQIRILFGTTHLRLVPSRIPLPLSRTQHPATSIAYAL